MGVLVPFTQAWVELASRHPGRAGKSRAFDQPTELLSVNEPTPKVSAPAGNAELVSLEDPRAELEEQDHRAAPTRLLELRLRAVPLGDRLLWDLLVMASAIIDRLEPAARQPRVRWHKRSSDRSRALRRHEEGQ